MDLIWLAPLILGAGFAVAGGQDAKWKSLNLLIIVGCMALGFGIGYAAGLGSQNFGRVPKGGWLFSMMFGIVAAMVCVELNTQRGK